MRISKSKIDKSKFEFLDGDVMIWLDIDMIESIIADPDGRKIYIIMHSGERFYFENDDENEVIDAYFRLTDKFRKELYRAGFCPVSLISHSLINIYKNEEHYMNTKPNTVVRIMLDRYGEPYLRTLWQSKGGAPGAAKVISDDLGVWCTSGRFEYLAKLFGWRRKIDPMHPIALGVLRGTTKKEDYPHVIFPGDIDYE